jgi:F-type H+-transporting ATPase subunit epsilon
MSKIKFELVTPEKLFFSADVDSVVVPGAEGDFGVLHNHAPMISTIRTGILSIEDEGKKRDIFISGGFAEVTNECCTILAENAIDTSTISEDELKRLLRESTAVAA